MVVFSFQFGQVGVQCGGDESVGAGDSGDQVGVVGEPCGFEDPLVQGEREVDADPDSGACVLAPYLTASVRRCPHRALDDGFGKAALLLCWRSRSVT